MQVALHTDGLNECLSVDDTLRVLDGRTIHAFHIEGCGGGHVPNVLQLAGVANVIGSSTNPTLPFGRDALDEHYEMIFAAHGLNHHSHTRSRDRARPDPRGTMGAEGVLHDLGRHRHHVVRRAGHGSRRRDRAAHVPARREDEAGRAATVRPRHDNDRVRQYIAKLTINPAIAHGLAHEIGSLDVGKLADIVLWRPDHFGAKPQLVLKAGFPAYGVTGRSQRHHRHVRAARARPAVRRVRRDGGRPLGRVRQPGAPPRPATTSMTTRRRRVAVRGTRGIGPRRPRPQRPRSATSTSIPRTGSGHASTASAVDSEPVESGAPQPPVLPVSRRSANSTPDLAGFRCRRSGRRTSARGWSCRPRTARSATAATAGSTRYRRAWADGRERDRALRAGDDDLQRRRARETLARSSTRRSSSTRRRIDDAWFRDSGPTFLTHRRRPPRRHALDVQRMGQAGAGAIGPTSSTRRVRSPDLAGARAVPRRRWSTRAAASTSTARARCWCTAHRAARPRPQPGVDRGAGRGRAARPPRRRAGRSGCPAG